jgi:hypothetical protein
MDSLTLFFAIQLERIKQQLKGKVSHAPGPKRASLAEQELPVKPGKTK